MPQPRVWESSLGTSLSYWSREQLLELWRDTGDLKTLANACRLNAITAIQYAGSGHIGTSLSSLDIMVAVRRFLEGDAFLKEVPHGGVFFSSKGHDAPAYYALLHLMGQLGDDDLFTLRRLGGLPGHPETITPGVPTNTGSLGMGISKAKGFIKAQRLANPDSRDPVVVMLGDGELNEGQIWESMPGAIKEGFSELIAIVDANQIQSDTWTEDTMPMGDLRKRVEGSGWIYLECDGQDPDQVLEILNQAQQSSTPTFIVASTTKGAGVPWMESFPQAGEYYKFHSGALAPVLYAEAVQILTRLVTGESAGSSNLESSRPEFDALTPKDRPESLLTVWEDVLAEVMASHTEVVALDGDLSYDTGTHRVRHAYPERYLETGIAEQDMVSMAGTLALSGHTPIVHSFATFLTMRATEQIFNNATEYSRVIYVGFLAGLVPSAPGFSHQAVTDVGIMGSLPGMRVFEPSCRSEVAWAISEALSYDGPSFLRMGTVPPVAALSGTPSGSGLQLRVEGSSVALVTSGPLLAGEAIGAAEAAAADGVSVAVFTRPELSAPLSDADREILSRFDTVISLENFAPARAHHHGVSEALRGTHVVVLRWGIEGIPANGQPAEVLAHHGLDASSIVQLILQNRP